jgi:hypothetical protein
MYVIQHGLPEHLALELIQLTLIAVALSILVHGTSVKPLMSRLWPYRRRRPIQWVPGFARAGNGPQSLTRVIV